MPATTSNETSKLALPFVGRKREIDELLRLHTQRKHVLILGREGVGKSALIRQLASLQPLLVCPQSTRLSDLCAVLENQLAVGAEGGRLIPRKNRVLNAVAVAGRTVVFDQVGWTTPKLSSFLECVSQRVPVWIITRSEHRWDIGHFWPLLPRFVHIELQPFHLPDTRELVGLLVSAGQVPVAVLEAAERLHRMSAGVPQVLAELLEGLATGRYNPQRRSDMKLLDLDRRIQRLPSPAEHRSGFV